MNRAQERAEDAAAFDAVVDDFMTWPEPGVIHAPLRPVPKFDPDALLPDSLRRWIMDEASRMPCPPDFVAAAALVGLGSIIGARCAIKPKAKDDWTVVPNLWGGVLGLPSAKKTPGINAAMRPLDKLIARSLDEHREALEAHEADHIVFEAQAEAIEASIKKAAKSSNGTNGSTLSGLSQNLQSHKKEAPTRPTLRRFKSNDSTVEKLGELLRENPAGILVLRDELVGLIANWDREGREGDRAFFLEAWNGNGSFDTDRIGRGSIFIPNLCVSIFGGIQPDKLTAYLEQASNALANDGMLQRFQVLVYPDPTAWKWIDQLPNKQARDSTVSIFEKLADFDPVTWGAVPADDFAKFPCFKFDDEAQRIFIEWATELHGSKLLAEDNPIMAQHLSKFDKLFPAIALILHLVERAAGGSRESVGKESALRAAAWCEYLEAHARRCYGLLMDDGLRAAQALSDKIKRGHMADEFTARDVRRNQWRHLTTDNAVQAALDWLEDEGWIESESVGGTGPGTGRRTTLYRINPKVTR